MQVSCKGSGYYGCSNARRKECSNKMLIPRRQVEAIILNDLKEKYLRKDFEMENGKQVGKRSYYVAHTSIQTLALLNENR